MKENELKKIRNSLHYEWERQTWDAFMVPFDQLNMSEDEQRQYASQARHAAEHICWDTYDVVRRSFMNHCAKLLHEHGHSLSNKQEKQAKEQMYIRFMEGRISFFQYKEKQEAFQGDPIPVGQDDLHNVEMAAIFAHLPPQPEVASFLETIRVSWNYDQLHMVTWFSGQLSLGQGDYSRSRPNHSAKKTYERLLNPYSLLWIVAALGEDQEIVRQVAYEMRDYASYRAKCGVIRRAIPWKRIYGLAMDIKDNQNSYQE